MGVRTRAACFNNRCIQLGRYRRRRPHAPDDDLTCDGHVRAFRLSIMGVRTRATNFNNKCIQLSRYRRRRLRAPDDGQTCDDYCQVFCRPTTSVRTRIASFADQFLQWNWYRRRRLRALDDDQTCDGHIRAFCRSATGVRTWILELQASVINSIMWNALQSSPEPVLRTWRNSCMSNPYTHDYRFANPMLLLQGTSRRAEISCSFLTPIIRAIDDSPSAINMAFPLELPWHLRPGTVSLALNLSQPGSMESIVLIAFGVCMFMAVVGNQGSSECERPNTPT